LPERPFGHPPIVKIAVTVVLTLAVLGTSAASADPMPAPAGTPNVLCRKPTFPGRAKPTTPGSYSYMPRSCTMEAYTPSGNEQSIHLLAIEWREWTGRSAAGTGSIPLIEENPSTDERRVGRERVTITLGHPRSRCGRLVFTRARVHWFFGDFEYSYRLHQVPTLGRGCP
jgi:hypothetical protein